MEILNHFNNKKIYHVSDSDLDGAGCRTIGEFFIFEHTDQYYPHHMTVDKVSAEFNWKIAETVDVIFFTDLVPTKRMYAQLKKEGKEVHIFDHHPTSHDYLKDIVIENYHYDVERCSAKIFYDYLSEGTISNFALHTFVDLVNAYDLFLTTSDIWEQARSLSHTLWLYMNFMEEDNSPGYEKFALFNCRKFSRQPDKFFFSESEKKRIKSSFEGERKAYEKADKSKELRVDGRGNSYFYIELGAKISYTCQQLLENYPEVDYIACYNTFIKNDCKTKFSLRGRKGDDFLVRPIAELYNGGGHDKAAGFSLENHLDLFTKFRTGQAHLV